MSVTLWVWSNLIDTCKVLLAILIIICLFHDVAVQLMPKELLESIG